MLPYQVIKELNRKENDLNNKKPVTDKTPFNMNTPALESINPIERSLQRSVDSTSRLQSTFEPRQVLFESTQRSVDIVSRFQPAFEHNQSLAESIQNYNYMLASIPQGDSFYRSPEELKELRDAVHRGDDHHLLSQISGNTEDTVNHLDETNNRLDEVNNHLDKVNSKVELLQKSLGEETIARKNAEKKAFRNAIICSVISGIIVLLVSQLLESEILAQLIELAKNLLSTP